MSGMRIRRSPEGLAALVVAVGLAAALVPFPTIPSVSPGYNAVERTGRRRIRAWLPHWGGFSSLAATVKDQAPLGTPSFRDPKLGQRPVDIKSLGIEGAEVTGRVEFLDNIVAIIEVICTNGACRYSEIRDRRIPIGLCNRSSLRHRCRDSGRPLCQSCRYCFGT